MEVKQFEGETQQFHAYTFLPKETGQNRFGGKTKEGKSWDKARKEISIPMDLLKLLQKDKQLAIHSHVHNKTHFLPLLIDEKYIVDAKLQLYILRFRYSNPGFQNGNWEGKKYYVTVEKFICPHHRKKNPQLVYLDGIFHCRRCNRILNDEIEGVSHYGETESGYDVYSSTP